MNRPGTGWWPLLRTPLGVAIGLVLIYLYVALTPARLGDDQILQWQFLESRLLQHIELVVVSFLIAALVAVPLGIALAGAGRGWRIVVFLVANLGQAVPSIAALALAFTVVGLGLRSAVIALVAYALLPILRNTLLGLQGVDPAIVDAARGMGMTNMQALRRVQLPLASPVIFAGLRTALVLVVATATLGNFIGAGGLGDVIAAGIGAGRDRIVVTGAGLVAALALLFDWGFAFVERALTPRR
ncbi:MAG TPA: ABC transporter permease [Chloroflexota bacterium]|jgi:ABC-type proline/glycine betaine transport system permease subunit